MIQIQFYVDGMTCAACVAAVERALKSVPGVTGAQVNLATKEAKVTYEEASATPEALYAAVAEAGYEAVQQKAADARAEMERVRDLLQEKIRKNNTNTKFTGYLKQMDQGAKGMLYNQKR